MERARIQLKPYKTTRVTGGRRPPLHHLRGLILRSMNRSIDCHITPLLFDLHWLPVKFRIEFKILLITFKALKGLAPTYIDSLISIKSTSRYDLRSSNDSLLLSYPKPLSKATLGDRSFTYAAPKLWNALPLAIRSVNTVNDFKGKLKTYLVSKAFLFKSE